MNVCGVQHLPADGLMRSMRQLDGRSEWERERSDEKKHNKLVSRKSFIFARYALVALWLWAFLHTRVLICNRKHLSTGNKSLRQVRMRRPQSGISLYQWSQSHQNQSRKQRSQLLKKRKMSHNYIDRVEADIGNPRMSWKSDKWQTVWQQNKAVRKRKISSTSMMWILRQMMIN